MQLLNEPNVPLNPPDPKASYDIYTCSCGKEIETNEPWELQFCDYTDGVICDTCLCVVQSDFFTLQPVPRPIATFSVTSQAFKKLGLENQGIEKEELKKLFLSQNPDIKRKNLIDS